MAGQNVIVALSISPQVLLSQQLAITEAALYTVPAATSVKIAQGTLCNVTSAPVVVYLSIVKAGGTMGDGTHRVISGYSLLANDTLSLRDYLGGAMLGPGDFIAGYSSTATAVDLVISGTVHA
ncbi:MULTISPECIES: hypothetical protein [unclassified Cryobacterium]|uniref:hypothetical protein n=1 Tax=unclassified Cryobacterium TaxID=2649013 RepID=UPI001069EDE2|nr:MULTISPECIES: hypothetical protein [unclassified Cryobacterium]TFB96512.1 hypothetical protein E3O39_10595 [Cryobacterium sp. MDB2-A-1]TFC12797.1 hypothetical protein E3O35_07760 [Cryobacterium sp. MDB2-A-2]